MSPGCVPGVEAATGSLGHGLPLGLGMALAGRIRQQTYRVCVVLSDGECNEGSVWEAAMFAAAQKLDNVCGDRRLQQVAGDRPQRRDHGARRRCAKNGRPSAGTPVEVDGHDFDALIDELAPRARRHAASRVPSSRTRSRAAACRSWKTTTTGTIAFPTAEEVAQAACKELRAGMRNAFAAEITATGRRRRARRAALGRHRQSAVRRVQDAISRTASSTAAWPRRT